MGNSSFKFTKNRKWLGILITIIVVLTIGTASYLLLSGGKSARERFLDAESKNFKRLSQHITRSYQNMEEVRQPYLAGSYKSRTELTVDVKSGETATAKNSSENAILDIIKKFKLVIDSRQNPSDRSGIVQLSLLLEKTPFIDAEITSKAHEMVFTVPVLTPNRYFSVNTDKLDEVYNRFNIPVRPKNIAGLFDPMGTIYYNNQEFDRVASDYGSIISKAISEKDVRYGKNVDVNISGQKVKGREILVNPNEESSSALLKELTEKASADDILLKLTYGNLAAVTGVVDDAGIFQLLEYLQKTGSFVLNDTEKGLLTSISSNKNLAGFQKALSEAMNGYVARGGINMRLVVDNSGNILDRQLSVDLINIASKTEYAVKVHSGTNDLKYNDFRNRFIDISINETNSSGSKQKYYLKINPSFEPAISEGDCKGRLEVGIGLDKDGITRSGISAVLNLDASIDKLTAKKINSVNYAIDILGEGISSKDSLKGEVNTTSWKNKKLNTKNSTTAIAINADLPSFGITGYTVAVNLAKEDRLGLETFNLPEIVRENVIDLNTASEDELKKVENDILASFGTFYMTNKPIVDAVLGKK